MQELGKILVVIGLVLSFIGALLWTTGGLGKLPGDIVVQKGHSTFYFPIVTCVLLSLALTLLSWLLRK